MSIVLSFIPKKRTRKKIINSGDRGMIIIFPGVRYERLESCKSKKNIKQK